MYNFILQLSLIASLAIIIYLLARTLPRVQEEENHPGALAYIEKWLNRLPLHKIDTRLNIVAEKSLRKTRILLLRFDNFLGHYLNKKNQENQTPATDFLNQINKKD